MMNLGEWIDKADSIKHNPTDTYGVILFDQIGWRGECKYNWTLSIPDLSTSTCLGPDCYYYPLPPLGNDNLASLVLFDYSKTFTTGTVTFYDEPDCQGNRKSFTIGPDSFSISTVKTFIFWRMDNTATSVCFISGPGHMPTSTCTFEDENGNLTGKTLDKNIKSIELNGYFDLLLNTEMDFGGKCQYIRLETESVKYCIPNFLWRDVWGPLPSDPKIRSLMIIPKENVLGAK